MGAPHTPPPPFLCLQMFPLLCHHPQRNKALRASGSHTPFSFLAWVLGVGRKEAVPRPWRPQVTRTPGARLQLEEDLCPRVLLDVGSRPCCPSHTQQGSADQPGHTPALPQSRGPSEFRGPAEAECGSGSWTQAALCSVRVPRVCQALPPVLKMILPGEHHLSRCVCMGMEPHGCPLTKVTG